MKIMLKTTFLALALCLTQFTQAQDRTVKSFFKAHKSDVEATYVNARSGEDFNFKSGELDGVMGILGEIGAVKLLSLNNSSELRSDFKHLKNKLNQKYDTFLNLSEGDGGISVFTDEDNGYLYALIQDEDNIVVVALEKKD